MSRVKRGAFLQERLLDMTTAESGRGCFERKKKVRAQTHQKNNKESPVMGCNFREYYRKLRMEVKLLLKWLE